VTQVLLWVDFKLSFKNIIINIFIFTLTRVNHGQADHDELSESCIGSIFKLGLKTMIITFFFIVICFRWIIF